MKKIITTLIIISMLGVPSFVYAKGEVTMDYTGLKKTVSASNAYNSAPIKKPQTTKKWTISAREVYPSSSYSAPTQAPIIDYQALYEAQLRAKTAALENQRNSALSSLDNQQVGLTNDMYGKRNQAGAQSDIGKMNFAQFMASRGVAGNAGAMPEIYANNALQGNIGALNQQEAMGNAQIEANKTNVNSAYQNDLTAAQNQNEADLLRATINQQNVDRVATLEQSKLAATTKTAADVTAYNRLQDTKSDYGNTVGQFKNDYQAEIDKVANDGDPSNDWQISVLAAARQKKMEELDEIKKAEAAATAKATESKQKEAVNNALQLFGQLGYITPQMAEILQSYGLPTDIVSLNKLKAQSSGGSSGGSSGSGSEKPWYLQ